MYGSLHEPELAEILAMTEPASDNLSEVLVGGSAEGASVDGAAQGPASGEAPTAVVGASAEGAAGVLSPDNTGATGSVVLKNTLFLVVAQIIGTPLSVLVNAVVARRLGPEDFGTMYLATTFASLGFIAIEWGQGGSLPGMVARDRRKAGELVGSGLVFRGLMLLAVYPLIAAGFLVAGYGTAFQEALALVFISASILSATSAGTDTVLGFERTDIRAYSMVGQQIITAAIVLPTVFLGGHLRATLIAIIAATLIQNVVVWRAVLGTGLGKIKVSRATLQQHFREGMPFLALGIILALQPSVDAILLAKLGTPESVGWHAAARKLVGVLVFPSAALMNSMYPTLCRVLAETPSQFNRTVGSALRTATVLVVPVALGAALYPDLGIRIFSQATFAPAENNLRILSLFLFLVYFSMPLGSAVVAFGKQRAWAVVQSGCIVVSAIVDPILVPWFQAHTGNGGLGVCVATVVSEVFMVAGAIWLAPRGIFDRSVLRGLGLAAVAGCAMAATARLLSGITPFVAAPLAVVAYVACLSVTGGLDKAQLAALRGFVTKKLNRFKKA
jgi:O-antigen/teichoic acid export membrane protein